ncbi:LysR family transcriptional regulator [Sinirhodobacter populi]|uniref:LysR family transcriptional regulator n=1 Tax=Paenirhodobacter populi TaxID=2306993 RepID=A0A443KBG2_9RHOB|nr:LysR family transcriptional regulator [Sinirhodobacter populi]RWR30036.1 LysR family transcriptional regulator [Sinirhodobacter populi]
MRKVDLGWTRIFVEAARCGSLSEAAARLNITQPAVSYQIRRAEAGFGTPLLRRLHRGVELTDAGRRLFDILAREVDQIDRLAEDLRRGPAKTMLRLFTDYAFSALWLIPRIERFRAAWPEFDLQVIATQRTDPAQLQAGDLAVIFGRGADLGRGAVPLLPEVVVPVRAAGFAAGLAQAPLIHLDSQQHPPPWFTWADYFAAFGMEREPRTDRGDLRFNTYSLVIEAALAGQGVALGWRGLIEPFVDRGLLIPAGPELAARDAGAGDCGYHMLPGGGDTEGLQRWLLAECAAHVMARR